MRKRWAGLVLATVLSSALTGCSLSTACPAIGWINSVTVTLDGDVQNVDVVELCADRMCSRPQGSQQATEDAIPFIASAKSDTDWEVQIGMQAPKAVSVRALSADGRVLAETEANLDWRRVGGSERCGGPQEADPVTLQVKL